MPTGVSDYIDEATKSFRPDFPCPASARYETRSVGPASGRFAELKTLSLHPVEGIEIPNPAILKRDISPIGMSDSGYLGSGRRAIKPFVVKGRKYRSLFIDVEGNSDNRVMISVSRG